MTTFYPFHSTALALLLASVVSGYSPAASAPQVVRAAAVALRLPSRGSLLAAHFDVGGLGVHGGALGAEEGLAYALKRLVRRTPSHTVTGVTGSRDWRGVFDSLTGDLADTVSIHALRDVTYAIAGPRRLRRSEASASELESIISRFDTNQDGSLTFPEYAPRSTTTPVDSRSCAPVFPRLRFENMLMAVCGTSASATRRAATLNLHPVRYTTRSIWLSSLCNIGGSQVLRGILQPLLAVTATALLVACIQLFWGVVPGRTLGKSLAQMHTLLGGALSLLLVFRTNAAYNRFWEARKIWESVLNRCRDLARFIYLYQEETGAERVSRLISLLCAFPRELRAHLVGRSLLDDLEVEKKPRPLNPPMRTGLRDVLVDAEREWLTSAAGYEHVVRRATAAPMPPAFITKRLESAGNRPLLVCKCLSTDFKAIPDSLTFTSRERLMLLKDVNQLSSYIGACERLLQTPVPLSYARHTSRFLALWCLTLPFSLVESMGLLIVPVTAFVTWCLFGIQEIGLFIEHCALDDGGIFMDTITELVALDVMETFAEPPPHQLGYPEEAARPPLVCTQALICTSATSSGAAAVAAAASTAPLYDPLAAHENRPLKHLAINGRPEPSAPARADNGRPEPSAPSRAASAGAGAAEEESLDVVAATRGMTRVLYEEYTNSNANYNDYYP